MHLGACTKRSMCQICNRKTRIIFLSFLSVSVSCDHMGDVVTGCCSFCLCWLDAQIHTLLVCWRSIFIFLNLSWSSLECFRLVSIMPWSALFMRRRLIFQFMTKCTFVSFIHVQFKVAFHGKNLWLLLRYHKHLFIIWIIVFFLILNRFKKVWPLIFMYLWIYHSN